MSCRGARNLLDACLGVRPGERITIVAEPEDAGYYDSTAVTSVIDEALDAGLYVRKMSVSCMLRGSEDEARLLESVADADHVVFFARAGDQIRFRRLPEGKRFAMSYALDRGMLDSPYCTTSHAALCRFKEAVDDLFDLATEIHVTCPRGTDLLGRASPPRDDEIAEVGIRRFPMLVPKPISARGFAGRVVLTRFLIGTGSRSYAPWVLPLEGDVTAHIAGGRLVRFEGRQSVVGKINAHYVHIATRFGIDPWAVHSWHPGIHPGCRYDGLAETSYERWGGAAFGNPRILHFHTCGDYAPGEISWNLFDPTIVVDGVTIWDQGRLLAERVPGAASILAEHEDLAELFDHPCHEIGIL